MVSISTERWSTPRPNTIHTSSLSLFVTRRARFRSSSLVRRSAMWREVTNLPSLPKKGESFMVNVIDMVGSSMAMRGSGSGLFMSATVSPISNPSMPTSAHMSPLFTLSTFLRPMPSNVCSSLMRCFTTEPSFLQSAISIPSRISPLCTRPMAIRPT